MAISNFQKSIAQPTSLKGIGLHSGQIAQVTIKPAPINSGLNLNGQPVTIGLLTAAERATKVGEISLVEHLFSAAYGLGLDNLSIVVNGPEIPGMDGSALPFVQALEQAGIIEQSAEKSFLTAYPPIHLASGESSLDISPYNGFQIDFMVKFEGIGDQFFSFDAEKLSYAREIAPARTFGYLEEYEGLKVRGLALGASADNSLILSREGYKNEPRFPDEIVRHKILDLIGDLALLGRPLKARIKAVRSGHKLNAELVRRLING